MYGHHSLSWGPWTAAHCATRKAGVAVTPDLQMAPAARVGQLPLPPDATELLVYQQRTADGRIVLTDRPLAGAATQRTWRLRPDDPGSALQRREEAPASRAARSASRPATVSSP